MSYFLQDGYSIIKKHYVLVLLYFIKFTFFLLLAIGIWFIGVMYREVIGDDIVNYIFFPLVFALINYSFFKFILWAIEYFNYLFIIHHDQIFIINSSLIMRNDIEVVDAFKIVKLDAYSRWFFSNLLWFWRIIIETQTKEERVFRFMPKPYKLLDILKKQRQSVLEERKKKYIVDDDINQEPIKTITQ